MMPVCTFLSLTEDIICPDSGGDARGKGAFSNHSMYNEFSIWKSILMSVTIPYLKRVYSLTTTIPNALLHFIYPAMNVQCHTQSRIHIKDRKRLLINTFWPSILTIHSYS